MAKTSTPTFAANSNTSQSSKTKSPKQATLNFLRQFARVYHPEPSMTPILSGTILN
ncbi:MAG: hypothetical protein NC111_03240 [Bacteroides sp.]|nr:hypothetical protein [Bacteroides sp.]MCM1412861.1 hypothetical protein [Bacteroides sp.]MCM1471530.1 hypothetical protein [Bacteroides sp.]